MEPETPFGCSQAIYQAWTRVMVVGGIEVLGFWLDFEGRANMIC